MKGNDKLIRRSPLTILLMVGMLFIGVLLPSIISHRGTVALKESEKQLAEAQKTITVANEKITSLQDKYASLEERQSTQQTQLTQNVENLNQKLVDLTKERDELLKKAHDEYKTHIQLAAEMTQKAYQETALHQNAISEIKQTIDRVSGVADQESPPELEVVEEEEVSEEEPFLTHVVVPDTADGKNNEQDGGDEEDRGDVQVEEDSLEIEHPVADGDEQIENETIEVEEVPKVEQLAEGENQPDTVEVDQSTEDTGEAPLVEGEEQNDAVQDEQPDDTDVQIDENENQDEAIETEQNNLRRRRL